MFAHAPAIVGLDHSAEPQADAPGGGDLTRACKSSLGKLETPVEVAWRYNRTDLFPLFAARGIEIPSGRPPQDLMESFISGMPTS